MRISDWSSDVCSSDLMAAAMHTEFASRVVESASIPGADHVRRTVALDLAAKVKLALAHQVRPQGAPWQDGELARLREQRRETLPHRVLGAHGLRRSGGRRSEERRVGNECVSAFGSRWAADH